MLCLWSNSVDARKGDAFLLNPSGVCFLKYYPALIEEYKKWTWDLAIGISRLDGTPIVPSFDFERNRTGVRSTPHGPYGCAL
jgi:hypothetical protein